MREGRLLPVAAREGRGRLDLAGRPVAKGARLRGEFLGGGKDGGTRRPRPSGTVRRSLTALSRP
jgi:hypothetical protein